MTDTSSSPDSQPLQLDRVEPGEGGAASTPMALPCSRCGTAISDAYFEVNGAATCRSCHARLVAERAGGVPILRFLGAFGLGSIAAVIGFLVYWAVLAWTGYEVALISILVGLLVGVGVKLGSRGRGGWLYQLMAVALTYVSICASYVPVMISQMEEKGMRTETEAALEGSGAPAAVEPVFEDDGGDTDARDGDDPAAVTAVVTAAEEAPAEAAGEAAETKTESSSATPPDEASSVETAAAEDAGPAWLQALVGKVFPQDEKAASEMGCLGVALVAVVVVFLVLALPFLAGFENILGLLIIGVGLYQAWKINRKSAFVTAGPFQLGSGSAAAPG